MHKSILMSGICYAAADAASGITTDVVVPEGMPQAWFLSLSAKQRKAVDKAGKDHPSVVKAIDKWKAENPDDPLADDTDADDTADVLADGTDETQDAHTIEQRTVTLTAANENISLAVDAAKAVDKAQWDDVLATAISAQKNAVVSARLAQAWLYMRTGDGKLVVNSNMIGTVMSWPEPGSTRKELDAAGRNHERPDKFSYKRPSEKDGEERNVNSSFYGEQFDASPAGKANADLLADISAALGTDPSKLTPRAAEYRKVFMAAAGKSEARQAQEAATVKGRRTAAIGYIRQSVKAVRIIQAINKTLAANNVRASFVTELADDGKSLTVTSLKKPCKVFAIQADPTTGAMTAIGEHYFTIPTFVRLNVAKAVEKGGTLDALVATVAKAPRTGGSKGKDKFKQPELPLGNLVAFELTAAAFANWLDNGGNYQVALKAMPHADQISDAFAETLTMLYQSIGGLLQARPKTAKTPQQKAA